MSERLTRRDMLKIAGVAALGSALGTASVGGGLIYFSRSEPQPVSPVSAKPEYAPPPSAPVAKAEPQSIRAQPQSALIPKAEPAPLPLPAKPVDKPTAAAIPAETAESIPSTSSSKEELVIDIGISSRIGRIDWGLVFHPATILMIWAPGVVISASVISKYLPKGKYERCQDCGSTNGSHYHS